MEEIVRMVGGNAKTKNIYRIVLALIIGSLFAVRVVFSLGNTRSLFIDVYSYEKAALDILNHGFSSLSAYHPPAYPTFIALCYALFGRSMAAVYIVQAILASISLILIYRITEKLAGSPAAVSSVAACAFYWPLTLYSGIFLSETLFIFLLLSGVYAFICFLEAQKARYMAFSALFSGLSALTRSINLLFILIIPCLFLLFVLIMKKGKKGCKDETPIEKSLKSITLKKALIHCAVFAGIFIATLAPWTIRNLVLFNDFIPVDTLGGLNLLVGNNEYGKGVYISFSDEQFEDMIERYTGKRQPLRVTYPNGRTNLNDKALREAGIQYILKNPGRFLHLTYDRAMLYLKDDFINFDWVLQTALKNNPFFGGESAVPWFRRSDILFFIAGLLGLPFLLINRRTRWLFLLILYYWGTTSCFYVTSRYRIPIMPFMAISAGMLIPGIASLFGSVSKKLFRKA